MGVPERLIFGSSVEALLKTASGKVSKDTDAKLRRLGMALDRKLEPAYPATNWAEAVRLIGADLFPNESPEKQANKLARLTVKNFAETVMGKAMFTAARVFGARRSLQRMTHNLRTGANFIETRFTEIDETTHELWISDVSGVPGFYAGLVEAGSDFMEGWVHEMRIKQLDGPGCLYELKSAKPSR
ncbi:MAG: DUF2378 family protein [Myxococcaceae bacterium]|jgi:uncharacterized protein (TIGR02265 family)|nr:DUF2378 family protein [Myxococcaceae bacterium]